MNKLIVILDNGEPYPEDHRIHFVEVRAHFLKDFEKLLLLDPATDWQVIGVIERVKWCNKNRATAEYVLCPFWRFADTTVERWAELSPRYRRWILSRWMRDTRIEAAWKNDLDRLRAVK